MTVTKAGAHQDVAVFSKSHDLLIMNSVIQYFPNQSYLRHVLESSILRESARLKGGSDCCRIFIGDVRSFSLLYCFHLSIMCSQAASSTRNKNVSLDELDSCSSLAVLMDNELCVDPLFL